MRRVWSIVPCLAVTLAFAAPAAAGMVPSAGNPCPPAGTEFRVPAPHLPTEISDGFDCKNVNLVIDPTTIVPTAVTLAFDAMTITINGPVTINNDINSDSKIFLNAAGGSILISKATIQANAHLVIECKSFKCSVMITDGSFIKTPINPALDFGDTRAIAHGDVIIKDSTFFGKHKVGVFSQAGKVDWICVGGAGRCEDPLTSGTAIAKCGADPNNPSLPKLPCTPTFTTLAEVTGFCIAPGGEVECGGGNSECQVNAYDNVNLQGSQITCESHFHVTSKTGSINVKDATIHAVDTLSFQAFKNIDATDALLTSKHSVTLETKGGTPGPAVCITATNTEFVDLPDFQPAVVIDLGGGCKCTGPTTPPNAKCP